MELLNYSRQLMQQLQTLRKEGCFCDCTIHVGDAVHPAHKVVLAASSLLFKSLLESSHSISVDTAIISPQEFSSLLDLAYTGRLPPGKHNFSRVIAAADSLQMFDVAVGCRKLLDKVVKEAQNEFSGSASPASDAPGLNKDSRSVPSEGQKQTETDPGESQRAAAWQEDDTLLDRPPNYQQAPAANLSDYLSSVKNIPELLTQAADKCCDKDLKKVLLKCSGEKSRKHAVERLLSVLSERGLEETPVLLMLKDVQKSTTKDIKESKESADEKTGGAAAFLLKAFQIRLSELNLDPQLIRQSLQEGPTMPPDQREYLQVVLEETAGVGLMEKLIGAALDGGSVQPLTVWRFLLWAANFDPQLELLLREIREKPEAHPLLHAETECGSPAQVGAGSEKEEKEKEDQTLTRENVCQWCNKTFHYKCRLLTHRKRCTFSPERVQRCTECSLTFPSLSALQQHTVQIHNGTPAKKKNRGPVDCEQCGKTFKHPSGLFYHRHTEHLQERLYSCEECGAVFAARSSLKNHVRLHTGERPYRCKHCDTSFAVAAALSYHTKKKHAEGKMFACQYCSAAFAQSIELTRHVRTHTGDKPYVCRECGKGFRQANGLSVHLKSSHNAVDPHDCQKCRMSFSSLEKLRDHVQEVHPKDLHQCPECSKILSTGAQLRKHMSSHVGSKPYSCKDCNKSYQTLSGLWYHNRTIHQDTATSEGSRRVSLLLHCKICNEAFCNRSSMLKHKITKHPETCAGAEGTDEKEVESGAWRCVHCNLALRSEQALQRHGCSEHVSRQGSVFSCSVCSLAFLSEAEFQHHFLTNHTQITETHESTSPMVIKTEGADDSPQVFVAVGDSEDPVASLGIVAVHMEDLLAGRVTLISEENE